MQDAGSLAKNQLQCQAIQFAEGVALPLVDTVDLFGLTLDDSLNFGKHITTISKKVRKQLNVLCRLKKILSFRTKLYLYN